MLSTIIIGGGPGGLGPLIWAAQHGLPARTGSNAAWPSSSAAGRLGGSSGASASTPIRWAAPISNAWSPGLPEPLLPLRDDPLTREMARSSRRLSTAAASSTATYAASAIALASMLAEHPGLGSSSFTPRRARCVCAPTARWRSIAVASDGTGATLLARVRGGRGRRPPAVARARSSARPALADCRDARLMPSNRAAEPCDGLAEANDILAHGGRRRIFILGGSHSAYAVA